MSAWRGGTLPMAALYDDWWQRRNGGGDALEVYAYTDESGTTLFEVGRFEGKRFLQRRPGRRDWKGGIKGVRRVLYRLPRVLEAVEAKKTIYIVEGEKDVHALERAGFVGTCNPGGAGKWRREYADALEGADVIVVQDRDDAVALTTRERVSLEGMVDAHLAVNRPHERGEGKRVAEAGVHIVEALVLDLRPVVDEVERKRVG